MQKKLKLELVDVLHFALSASILEGSIEETILVVPFKSADIENYKKLLDLARVYNFMGLIYQLTHLAALLKFDLFGFYIAKYTLNRIRLLKGYKDGSYQKVHANIEDNEILLNLLPKNSFITTLDGTFNTSQQKIYSEMITNIYKEFQIPEEDQSNIFE